MIAPNNIINNNKKNKNKKSFYWKTAVKIEVCVIVREFLFCQTLIYLTYFLFVSEQYTFFSMYNLLNFIVKNV